MLKHISMDDYLKWYKHLLYLNQIPSPPTQVYLKCGTNGSVLELSQFLN